MLPVVVTREDATTECALVVEWLADDRAEVSRGQPICIVETTKATVEVVAPGDGTLLQEAALGSEVELGHELAVIAQSTEEVERVLERRAQPVERSAGAPGKVTRKARELAERHGVDLTVIDRPGFVTVDDVEALLAEGGGLQVDEGARLFDVSLEGVTLPAAADGVPEGCGLDPELIAMLRDDPGSFGALASKEKCEAYRQAGARIGEDVVLEAGAVLITPALEIGPGARVGRGASIECEEAVSIGALTHLGQDLEVRCRRVVIGENVHAGRSIRIGGGGHRDPWAVAAVGDLTFIGDDVFINVARPVLIGREVFLTQRAMLVTHNIGHSVLEGFENRFAPVVLEDYAQVGLASVVYAGCRIGERAIVGSSSYVVSDIPAGSFAVGVPARAAGRAQRPPSRARQLELAQRMLEELHELLALRGHAVTPLPDGGLELQIEGRTARVLFVERLEADARVGAEEGETVVMAFEFAGAPPTGVTVLDLLERTLHGSAEGVLVETVREFCRKRGIRFSPGPWRYRGGLI
ncbi:MAG: hypothetical protein OXG37_10700 [Actinomycetia bacterium]|nr:hypothetical protein [Actinomycetes bacterium]